MTTAKPELPCSKCAAPIKGDKCLSCDEPVTLDTYGITITSARGGYSIRSAEDGLVVTSLGSVNAEKVAATFNVPLSLVNRRFADILVTPLPEKTPDADKESDARELIDLARADALDLFRNQHDTPYLTFYDTTTVTTVDPICSSVIAGKGVNGDNPSTQPPQHIENTVATVATVASKPKRTVALGSNKARIWMGEIFFKGKGRPPSGETIAGAKLILEGDAYRHPRRTLYNRVAPGLNGAIWIDVADDAGRVLEVDEKGFRYLDDPPQVFMRYSHQLPLSKPDEKGNFDPLLKYLPNQDSYSILRNVVHLVTALVPDISHPMDDAYGPTGAGKSTKQLIKRRVVDPSSVPLLKLPKDPDEIAHIAEQNWFPIWDNVSNVDQDQSDTLCGLVTGFGSMRRKLYTDFESIIRSFKRPMMMNGVNVPVDQSDLMSRILLEDVPELPDESRIPDKKMMKMIEDDAPVILGGCLRVISAAMKKIPSVKLVRYFRLADFAEWGVAITEALGLEGRHFEEAYALNVDTQNEKAIENSIIAQYLIKYLDWAKGAHTETTAAELLKDIENFAKTELMKDLGRTNGWPGGVVPFGKELNKILVPLRAIGVTITKRPGKVRGIIIDVKDIDLDEGAGQMRLKKASKKEAGLDLFRLNKALSLEGLEAPPA